MEAAVYLLVKGVRVGLKGLEFPLHYGEQALLFLQLQLLVDLAASKLQQPVPHLILHLETGVFQVLKQTNYARGLA